MLNMEDEIQQTLQLPVVNNRMDTVRKIISAETVSYVNIEICLHYLIFNWQNFDFE